MEISRNKSGRTFPERLKREWTRNYMLYIMAFPVILYFLLFHYGPMYGVVMAFKDYRVGQGLWASEWVGLKHFSSFINGPYFFRTVRNTLAISSLSILFGFPAPIILALLLNEVKFMPFKRTVQTITYLPHFISIVVIMSMLSDLTSRNGAITTFLSHFGFEPVTMLQEQQYFLPLYIISGIWQNIGWNSIIYLSAIIGIDAQLYEAAKIDGAGKLRQLFSVTLPCLFPTIIIMFILQMGKMFNVGHEKILLMYNPLTYEVADVINTYVYREGLLNMNWSYSAAVGMFNSVVSFLLVWGTNKFSKKLSGSGLW